MYSYSSKKKYFYRLESDSARNNIHPNIKQKLEITYKNTGKYISIWPASLSVKGASKPISWFSPTFSGALVNATVLLTLLLKSFTEKKRFSRSVLANTARFLRFLS